jgi:hypothetical protein
MTEPDWSASLDHAAAQFHDGPRSFPLLRDASLARQYGYDPPNEDYQKLFFRQATVAPSQRDESLSPRSAGWLIPDEGSVCRPVFVAHSVLSAIWLLRETLADDALSNDGWHRLVSAATFLAQGEEPEVPPLAQRPPLSPSQRQKHAASSTQPPSSKRARPKVHGTPPASPVTVLAELSDTDYSELEQHAQNPLLHTVTVTNNNRRAERERSKKLALKGVQKRRELGLVEPDVKASRKDLIASNDRSRNRYGKGRVRTEALLSLLKVVSPNTAPTEQDRLVLRKRLARASRWYTLAQSLGWGSLALIPHDSIPNSWIESTLRAGELDVWVELVKKETPDIFAASRALETWLGADGIAGGPISGKKTLGIEARAPATIYDVSPAPQFTGYM